MRRPSRSSVVTLGAAAVLLGLAVVVGRSLWRPALTPVARHTAGPVGYERYEARQAQGSVHVVRIPRTGGPLQVTSRHAAAKAIGLTPVSVQLAQPGTAGVPVAAINGGFYQREGPYAGDARGVQIVDGELISAPDGGVAFWVDAEGGAHTGEVTSRLRVLWPGGLTTPLGLNESRPPDRITLYTPALGPSTQTRGGRELILEAANAEPLGPLTAGAVVQVRVRSVQASGNSVIPAGTFVLSLGSAVMETVPALQPGDALTLCTETVPALTGVRTAIGGGPVLVRGGKTVGLVVPKTEAYEFSSMTERHPRSAIGWNDEALLLVTVDGRREGSAEGMTLPELASFLVRLGCREAMNLDGGGSSTLWFDGAVRNHLGDGYEREVANALVILRPPTAPIGGPPVSDDPFVARPVWPVAIELPPDQLDRLRSHSRTFVPGGVRLLDQDCAEVGVKLKGHGSFQTIDEKPSFTVDFSAYVPTQSVGGLTKLHLNNSVHDPSYLRERLASELCRAAQLPVPRLAHALVQLNGRPLGLYVVKEGHTRALVRRHFQSDAGNLYDDDDGKDVDQRLDRDLGTGPESEQAALARLAAAAREPDLDRRWQRLQDTLDVDRFLTFMAMELMLGHWDGYCQGQNNFRVYEDPASGRIVFLPAGMDQAFAKADLPWNPPMTGLVARAVMETPQGKTAYAARFRTLFGEVFIAERWIRQLAQWTDALRAELPPEIFRSLQAETAALGEQLAARGQDLRRQLNTPEPTTLTIGPQPVPLTGWRAFDAPEGGRLREDPGAEPGQALWIVAGPRTMASWRTTVRLEPGRYRFEGRVRVAGVQPLSFGRHQGAALRVAGVEQGSAELLGTADWAPLRLSFDVQAPGGEMTFLCQLRASNGEAAFEKCSLSLVRER